MPEPCIKPGGGESVLGLTLCVRVPEFAGGCDVGMFLIALIPKLPDCGTFDKFLLFIEKNFDFVLL
jgi:hypothetical protein